MWQKLNMASELKSVPSDVVDWGKKWLVKSELVSFDRFNNTGAIYMIMEGSVGEEKSSFKMLQLTFSSKLGSSSY